MKRYLALVLSILMVLSLAACGGETSEGESGTEGGEETVKAVCILQDAGGAAWGATKNSFIRGCEELGWDWEFMAPTTVNSEPEMITLAENAVSVGCDVLVTFVYHGDMWSDVLLRAKEKGITVVSVVLPPDMGDMTDVKAEDIVDAVVGFEADEVVRTQARVMAEAIPEDVEITAVMFHQLIDDYTVLYYDALVDELTTLRPGTKFLGLEADDNKASVTADKLAALKLANPELNCVFGMDMGTALGCHSYIAENNLQGEMWAIGVDASEENLGAVKAGTVTAIIEQGYARFGEEAVEVARKILAGEEYEAYQIGEMSVITAENVDQWAADNGLGEIPEL